MHVIRTGILIVVVMAVCSFPASALEADEIALLVRRDVDESTIMDLVRARPLSSPLTAQDVVTLHDAGASSNLLSFLTGPEAAVEYVAAAPTETAVAAPLPPAATYSQPCVVNPQYITPAPVVVAPPVVYNSYPYYPRSTWSFNFGFGGGRNRYWRGHRHRGRHHRW